MKYNNPTDSESTMANEPLAAYGAAATSRPRQHRLSMPGVYTDEEFEEEIRQSLASGTVSNEEALARFAKWGFVL